MNRQRCRTREPFTWAAGMGIPFLILAVLPTGAAGQDEADLWLPWTGCWAPVAGSVEEPVVCFVHAGEGMERVTVLDGQVQSRQAMFADGRDTDISSPACRGTESARFSDDGLRLYTESMMACGSNEWREGSGIMAFFTPTQWIDVRTVGEEGGDVTSIRYFQMVDEAGVLAVAGRSGQDAPGSVREARVQASGPLSLDQVADASSQVHPAAVEAWMVEMGDGFQVDGDVLARMARTGVPESVIDLTIALSFPDRFAISRLGTPEQRETGARVAVGGGPNPAGPPIYADGYGAFGFGTYYSGGFGYYGFRGPPFVGAPYWYRNRRPIYVEISPIPAGTSAVVKGKGYTRGRGSGSPGSSSRGTGISGGSTSDDGVRSGTTAPSRGARTGRKAKRRGGG